MFWSRNNFFTQDAKTLNSLRESVVVYLKIKGYNYKEIEIYTDAFAYFCENPEKFDGATIVKDLDDLPNLDLDAMVHDYNYIVQKVARNFIKKYKADWYYAKGMERKGKGQYSAFSRFIVLTLTGIIFVPYTLLKNKTK